MSVQAVPKFFNPFSTPSPRKRPRVDPSSPEALLDSPTEDLAKIILEHLSRVDIVSPAPSPSQAYDKALLYAKERDTSWNLSPSKTIVERRPMVIPPKPQTFVHRHPKSYTNEIIMKYEGTTSQQAAYRVFLDSFYYLCGFRAWYQREDYKQGITPYVLSANFEGKNKMTYTKEEEKSFSRYHAVMATLPGIPNMERKDCLYLVGRLSGLDKLNKAHHHLPVRPMAVYLERLSKTLTPERRKEAVLKAWKWMTGYDSYEAAYENEDETRVFTDEGVKGEYDPWRVPDDLDEDDYDQTTRLMEDVSVYSSRF